MRRGRELGTAAALLLAGVAHDLAAQDAAARAEVSALQDRIAQMTDRRALEQLAREYRPHNAACALVPTAATPGDLEYGFILERIGELSRKRSDLLRALDCFSAFATSQPAWPMAWHGLGLTRMALARQSAMSPPGPLQPLGAVAIQGATAAFIRALELDSNYTDAAVRLPQTVHETLRVPIPLLAARNALRRTASTEAGRAAPVLLARALYERDTGSRDSTPGLLRRYLAAGGDSAVAYLGLAREAFAAGDQAAGLELFAAGRQRAGRSAEGRAAYRENLSWVASPAELAAFDALPNAAVDTAVEHFWARRDAVSGHAPGARLAEHFRRYEYAAANFVTPIRYPPGAPLREDLTAERETGPPDTTAKASLDRLFGDPTGEGTLLPAQPFDVSADFDPRAAVYLRYGPPDNRMGRWWAYYRSSGNIYVLVVPRNAAMFGDLGDLDVAFALPSSPTRAAMLAERLGTMWRRAHTTDEHLVRYRNLLEPVVQLFGMHSAPGGSGGRILMVFAIRGDRLNPLPLDTTGTRVAYKLHIRLISTMGGVREDHDTTRTFLSTRRLRKDEYLTGILELPARAGRQDVRVVLDEPGSAGQRASGYQVEIAGERGSVVRLDDLSVPPTSDDSLTLSDLVLGRADAGMSWRSPTGPVPLNPLNVYAVGADVSLYYEASGLRPGAEYLTTVTVRRADAAKSGRAVTVGFRERATATSQAFRRTVGLAGLAAGHYLVTLTMEPPTGGAPVFRGSTLNVSR